MGKKFKLVLILLIILLLLISPSMQAKNSLKNEEEKEIKFYGFIFGITGGVFEHANWPVGFTKLEVDGRTRISGYFGFYIIGFLEIGKTYEITASKDGYYDKTITIELTFSQPIDHINILMQVE